NVYKIFNRKLVDPSTLMTISKVLKFNFFNLYSQQLQLDTPDRIHIKLEIDMPTEEWKPEKIWEYCKVILNGIEIKK
ncbi:MAG: hypothetical protein LBU51_02310, partial [Bacteroidales bacterium]|nr:hypothetical protein [Bacteroidales bacterium]